MMIRTERHKLWTSGSDGEMYDVQNDPDEMHNLYHDPNFRDLRLELTERMLASRVEDDCLDSRRTRAEGRIYGEVQSSGEPEVPQRINITPRICCTVSVSSSQIQAVNRATAGVTFA